MKILIVHPHLTFLGGAELVVLKLSDSLIKMGIKNSVLTLSLSDSIRDNYRHLDFILPQRQYACKHKSISFLNALRTISETRLLIKMIKKFGKFYDVINAHNFPSTWGWVFSGVNRPVVWTCNEVPDIWHNPKPSISVKLLRNIGIRFDKLIIAKYVNTISCADSINSKVVFKRYRREPEIVPYGIDCEFFSENSVDNLIIRKYGLSGKFSVLQVGLITPEKNQIASIKAIEYLKNEMPNIKLILAGQAIGSYIDILKRYIHKKGIGEYVIFTGNLNKETLRSLYYLSNIVIFPVKTQGGWLAPFEALSCGKPIIVSTTMGASDIIRRKGLGVVSDNLVDGIRTVKLNVSKYEEVSKHAKTWVSNNLTYDKFAQRMIKLYQKSKEN